MLQSWLQLGGTAADDGVRGPAADGAEFRGTVSEKLVFVVVNGKCLVVVSI